MAKAYTRDIVLGTRTNSKEYRFFIFVLVYSHHRMLCTLIRTRTHNQCTRTRTRTRQMRSKLPDADVSALIFLKCMSCV